MNLTVPTTKLATEFRSVRQLLLFWLQDTVNTVAHQQKIIPFIPLTEQKRIISQKSDLSTSKPQKKLSHTSERLVTESNLSLIRVKKDTQVLYICAIALKLSKSWGKLPINIANQIEEQFSDLSNEELSFHAKNYFTLKVVPPGWLHLQITDLGIATWLQSLAEGQGGRGAEGQGGRGAGGQGSRGAEGKNPPSPHLPISPPPHLPVSPVPSPQSLIFSVQYAHARCCSLLRLAKGDGVWGAIAPDAIPWLNEMGQLRLTHPAECSLISQLLFALDALHCPESSKNPNWEKLAQEISLSWEDFYRQCRIWGEVKTETPELAQARLGLLMATQTILQLLLEEYLGVSAPLEL